MFIWRDQGKKKRKMQLENQSAGNFKSWLWSCYNFFDLFCNGHRIGSLIKLSLPVPDCSPNKVDAPTHALKSLPLLELHLLHSCMYTLLCFLGCSDGSWYLLTPEEHQGLPSTVPMLLCEEFWSPSLPGPFWLWVPNYIFAKFTNLLWICISICMYICICRCIFTYTLKMQ